MLLDRPVFSPTIIRTLIIRFDNRKPVRIHIVSADDVRMAGYPQAQAQRLVADTSPLGEAINGKQSGERALLPNGQWVTVIARL